MTVAGFALERHGDMTAVPPAALLAAAVEVRDPRAELPFVSCTALRTSQAVA
jgi:maleate isomerase